MMSFERRRTAQFHAMTQASIRKLAKYYCSNERLGGNFLGAAN
jgi:hypothetical protein